MKLKVEMFLPDVENYKAQDWLAWFSLVMAIGAVFFGVMALFS